MNEVFIICKNSMRTLENCIQFLERCTPNLKLTLVDGGSTNGTVRYAEERGHKVVADSGETRGLARQKAIELADGQFFAFIDDDVYVRKGWWDELLAPMVKDASIGGVTGVPVLHPQTEVRQYIAFRLTKRKIGIGKLNSHEGLHTGFCLIRKESVEGIKIPPWLQHRENNYITNHIRSNGYRCYRALSYFDHYAGGTWKGTFTQNAANNKKMKYWMRWDFLIHNLRSLRLIFNHPIWVIKDIWYTTLGWFKSDDYLYVGR